MLTSLNRDQGYGLLLERIKQERYRLLWTEKDLPGTSHEHRAASRKELLDFSYDYEYMVEESLRRSKAYVSERSTWAGRIYEFGSFTVGESGRSSLLHYWPEKTEWREIWNMIAVPSWIPCGYLAINQKFILWPWITGIEYERVFLGGLTCDSQDY